MILRSKVFYQEMTSLILEKPKSNIEILLFNPEENLKTGENNND